MDPIHRRFGNKLDEFDDQRSLVDYLLTAAPTYNRICTEDPLINDDDVRDNLGLEPPSDETNAKSKLRTNLTPYGCPCSKSAHVCVDTENACLACMECGSVSNLGFVHSFYDNTRLNTTPKYEYQPKAYLIQHLLRLEGYGHPKIASNVLKRIRDDLSTHRISPENVLPNQVYESLRRLRLARLYPHRWAVTRKINSNYRPLNISYELRERLESVFWACYKRYGVQRIKTKRKRKFLSYPLFIYFALRFLGVDENLEKHFKLLKSKTLLRKYEREIQCLLRGIPI